MAQVFSDFWVTHNRQIREHRARPSDARVAQDNRGVLPGGPYPLTESLDAAEFSRGVSCDVNMILRLASHEPFPRLQPGS